VVDAVERGVAVLGQVGAPHVDLGPMSWSRFSKFFYLNPRKILGVDF
jgi:hypothetical protein